MSTNGLAPHARRSGRGFQWTTPELRRAYELAACAGLDSGSIARLLTYEYGTARTPGAVRAVLRKRYGWTPRNH